MSKYERHTVTNEETGETTQFLVDPRREQLGLVENTKRHLSSEQISFLNDLDEVKIYNKSNGGHIHMCYVKNELLFNKLDIDRANISRLIYLATYIDYNDRQRNLLVNSTHENQSKEHMSRADMKRVLGLGDTAFKNFLSDMKGNNLIYEADKKFYINTDFFEKGKSNFQNKEYTRIYIDTTRFLYENTTSRQHKQLSYAFQLIPLLHYETNTICYNPSEVDRMKLEYMGLKNICEFLQISTEKKSMNKFENDLYKLQVKVGNNMYYMFRRVIVKGANGKFDYFVMNPAVIWKGRDVSSAKDYLEKMIFKNIK